MHSMKSLTKITPRHKEMLRRIVMGQTLPNVAREMGVSLGYLEILQNDALFQSARGEMEAEAHAHWLESRRTAMDKLQDHALEAAAVCVEAMKGEMHYPDGKVESVPIAHRLKSAFDVLDRTGNKAPERHLTVHANLQDMIIEAYKRRNGGNKPAEGASQSLQTSDHGPESSDSFQKEADIEPEDDVIDLEATNMDPYCAFEEADNDIVDAFSCLE